MLKNKSILIGITGGIAAYKIYDLIRLYKKNGATVKTMVTPHALNFVNKVTLQTLTNNNVYYNQFETEFFSPEHIALADFADILVIAPATANTIGKIANGICDNLLTSIACAFTKPMIIVPAMNTGMWENTFVQENIKKLKNSGVTIIPPESGFLACGVEGVGRMCEPRTILEKTVEIMNQKAGMLKDKKIVVTSGGTRENIDPVRYIGNYSSGKMGNSIADFAFEMGADVTLITTVDCPVTAQYSVIKVNTALEMKTAVEKIFPTANALIMAAAVADYRAKSIQNEKIKKNNSQQDLTIELVKNPDILAEISARKKQNQIVVGFCAETENLINNAKEKIQNKNCDYIVANDVSRSDITFGSDYNEVYIIDKKLNSKKIEKNTKKNVAKEILEYIFNEKK